MPFRCVQLWELFIHCLESQRSRSSRSLLVEVLSLLSFLVFNSQWQGCQRLSSQIAAPLWLARIGVPIHSCGSCNVFMSRRERILVFFLCLNQYRLWLLDTLFSWVTCYVYVIVSCLSIAVLVRIMSCSFTLRVLICCYHLFFGQFLMDFGGVYVSATFEVQLGLCISGWLLRLPLASLCQFWSLKCIFGIIGNGHCFRGSTCFFHSFNP